MSSSTSDVGGQIDEILSLSRNQTERDISSYRCFLYSVAMVLGFLTQQLTGEKTLAPGMYWVFCLGYAFVFRWLVLRYGAKTPLVAVGLILDLISVSAMFIVTAKLAPPGVDLFDQARWPMYLLPSTLYAFLLLNTLRSSLLLSVIGAVWSAILFLAVTAYFDGFHVQQAVTALIFLATGWVGLKVSAQARSTLDRFARFQLLRRYLPSAAVERVLTENPDEALALGGDLLTVTILAADLRNFTAMSEQLPPADVVRQLNAYHGAMLEVIDRHGGMLDKFIGDGTLVVFGLERVLPVKQKDAGAAAALACAKDMLQALVKLNEARERSGQPPLRMGIGIHTGPVVAGNIGAPGRRIEFTVVGDTVNTASRLEGLTKECGHAVVISAASAALLGNQDGLLALEPMKVKGKEQPLSVFGVDRVEATVAIAARG